jgi:hypothetical protein
MFPTKSFVRLFWCQMRLQAGYEIGPRKPNPCQRMLTGSGKVI